LVISATVWQIPLGMRAPDLYEQLGRAVVPAVGGAAEDLNGRVAIADSKVLYHSGKGLRHLERGLWATLALLDQWPDTWTEVWHALAPGAADHLLSAPWYAEFDAPVPIHADPAELEPLAAALRAETEATGIWLLDMVSRVVFPDEFNELVGRYESKGAALSQLTMELVRQSMEPLDGGPIGVICDKHGGRNHYARLLSQHFPDVLIEVRGEGRQQSVYRFGPLERRVEFRFCTRAESYLPVALASMASKYLRELAMQAFNEYWCDRVAGLEPTAGYPQDAQRFKDAIAAVQRELGIDDRMLWRNK
jgi:hypothetical protein